jgi:hypothetical protein
MPAPHRHDERTARAYLAARKADRSNINRLAHDHSHSHHSWFVADSSKPKTAALEQQQKRGAVVHHEPETLEQLEPTITRLAQRLVLAGRLCGPPRADRASYTTHLNPRGHKPRVPMIAFADHDLVPVPLEPFAFGAVAPANGRATRAERSDRKVLEP